MQVSVRRPVRRACMCAAEKCVGCAARQTTPQGAARLTQRRDARSKHTDRQGERSAPAARGDA
eukprot:1322153-Pleurochrysis_carterae.AAC.1